MIDMEIKKKTWPEFFELVRQGKKEFDLRLADFDVNPGDTLVFQEFDPETKQFTGREIRKEIKNATKIDAGKMWSPEEMSRYGFYVIDVRD
jgi:ASC-1-like (ASCH) protein